MGEDDWQEFLAQEFKAVQEPILLAAMLRLPEPL
jgi:hypothetical protein